MSPIAFISRQWIVSCVVLAVLQCSGAARFSRPVRYAAPSMRNYFYPWKYVPYAALPKSMQRRFMWRDMDDTVDELADGVATGARAMTHMFTPPLVRYRKPTDFESQSSSKVKYVLKKQPPYKRTKVIKFRAPKKPIQVYKNPTVEQFPSAIAPTKPNLIVPFMSQEELRKIEKEQERRVESGLIGGFHEHSHRTYMDDDVVSGKIHEFGESWLPVKAPYSTSKPFAMSTLEYSTSKPFAMSTLHTKVHLPPPAPPSETTAFTSAPLENFHSYEVTEHSAEESIQKETSFQPSNHFDFLTSTTALPKKEVSIRTSNHFEYLASPTEAPMKGTSFRPSNHFDFLASTTEVPNYPDQFLKSMQESQTFKPMRVRVPLTTPPPPPVTTSFPTTKPTLSNRLPSRSTTERPFKRYNLHRPKSSKLFFNRSPSAPSAAEQLQTTTTTEQSIALNLGAQPTAYKEPTSIRTTRESPRTTTTPSTSAKPPPENIRTARNNSEGKSKLRIRNISQNEDLKKVLNKHRGTVRFGEKQR